MAERDLVIVGGGPAGIVTALYAAHADPALAPRISVLEKERYPRDKYCAGAIGGRALRLLDAVGARPSVPFVAVHAVELRLPAGSVSLREPDAGIIVRRIEFDRALADEARRRGIEVRDGTPVEAVSQGADGARVRIAGGETIDARAVVGADGVAGVVRRTAGFARGRLRAQAVEVDTEGVTGDPPRDTIRFDLGPPGLTGYLWDFPSIVDGCPVVCRGAYRILDGAGGESARAHLERHLGARGLDVRDHRVKAFAEVGFEPGAPIAKEHVLLVGEAAGIDIATGEGIAQAIQYGALAGPYLARALAAGDLAFSDWGRRVRASVLGRQLRQRLWFSERFYGSDRCTMEGLLAAAPAGLRIGVRQFAGKPLSGAGLAQTVAQIVPYAARVGPSRALRLLRRAGS